MKQQPFDDGTRIRLALPNPGGRSASVLPWRESRSPNEHARFVAYAVGPLEICVSSREVKLAAVVQPLEPKAFDVLVHLIENRRRVVPKAELLDLAWRGTVVTEGVLAGTILKARTAIGDARSANPLIRTVHRIGYQFIGAVQERAADPYLAMPARSSGDVIASRPAIGWRSPSFRHSALAGARLLLVEDNAINQELARALLGRAGVIVTVAGDGLEAVDLLSRQSFDGVLMDCQMPVMDGFAAARVCRQQERSRRTPIIAMTANASASDRSEALAAGMDDLIGKPLEVDDMFATLVRWICPAGAAWDAPPGDDSRHALDDLPGIDPAVWRKSEVGDEALYRRLLSMFFEQQRDFRGAFLAALDQGEMKTARRLVHTLRSLAGTLGARGVEAAAKALEQGCIEGTPAQGLAALLAGVSRQLDPVIDGLRPLR